ncbi:MAG: hypothetical protein JOZ16_08165 [Methylobacteriaceae bacterium]|nr:hypothetical protein [Methylobacteriaceae bacterium]
MSYFDPTTWRPCTRTEIKRFFDRKRGASRAKPEESDTDEVIQPSRNGLIIQETISPFDMYTYLHARFGEPNGLQTLLARDDSDNLFHWDYMLMAGDRELMITGATQEVHVWVQEELTDEGWWTLIGNLRSDFGRVGRDKGRFADRLEKWHIFPNRYRAVADRCGSLYHQLTTSLPKLEQAVGQKILPQGQDGAKQASRAGKLIDRVVGAATELPILTPVMFESFIGMIVAIHVKDEVRRNKRVFESFQRSNLDVKLFDLSVRCDGFARPIEEQNPALQRFWRVVSRRNDLIHGNIDPVRDALEVVHFDGKRPLYSTGGDRIAAFWRGVIDQYRPQDVMDDYIATHEFIIEVLDHMKPANRKGMIMIMADTQPGWDARRGIAGKLFPDHVVSTYYPGLRCDNDLEPRPKLDAHISAPA